MPQPCLPVTLSTTVTDNVLSLLRQQQLIIQEQVLDRSNSLVATTAEVWSGNGADLFIHELSGLLIPEVKKISSEIEDLMKLIDESVQHIKTLDKQLAGEIRALTKFDAARENTHE